MQDFAVIVIGASAGGIGALQTLVRQLPQSIPAAILIVQHIGRYESILPTILAAAGSLPAKHAVHGAKILPGQILIAPPDHHMVVRDGHVFLSRGPRENWSRPAIDPLFRSAAVAFGEGAIGVILTGTMDDGVAGLYDIRRAGGIAVVQDPAEAEYPTLPAHALERVGADHRISLRHIGEVLDSLAIRLTRHAPQQQIERSAEHTP